MGKTPQPLLIMVDADWRTHPKVLELEAQGHLIVSWLENSQPDLTLSRSAWQWDDDRWPYLAMALKAARARKKATRGQ